LASLPALPETGDIMSRIGGYARAEHILILAWAFVLIRLTWPEPIPAPAGAVLMAA
jgi:hypothetical protein